jgi:hypothetical protein
MEDFNPYFQRLPLSVTCPSFYEENRRRRRRRRRRRSSFRIIDLPWYLLLIAFCMLAIVSALSVVLLRADDQIDNLNLKRAHSVYEPKEMERYNLA